MNKKITLVLLYTCLAFSEDLTLLNKQKQELQKQKLNEIDTSYESQKYDWVSPVQFSLSTNVNKSASTGANSDVNSASLGISQDLYRFGGISYKISYANANKEYKLISLDAENSALYQQIYTIVLTIKKLKLQLQQSQYKLENKDIDLFLKKEQYKTGIVDITSLNNAIMDKNSELQTMLNIKQNIVQQEKELAKYTPFEYDKIVVPQFNLIDKEKFLASNYQILQSQLQSKALNEQYKITKSNYYPHLTFSGELGYQDYNSKDTGTYYDGNYYSAGLKLSIPLDFNRYANTQTSKIAYLKEKLDIENKKIEQNSTYEQIVNNIKNYEEYQDITKKNIDLYSEVMDMTKKGFEAGYKTGYDLKLIQNTEKIDRTEITIYDINIQLELIKLHFMIKENNG